MSPIVCVIDGNIGAGKSVALDNLARRGFPVVKEDLDSWGKYLDLFYSDPHRWAFTLQIAILHSMIERRAAIETMPDKIVFMERSPDSTMVFTNLNYDLGYLTKDEYDLIVMIYEKSRVLDASTLKFLLFVDSETCLRRVKKRGRSCEANVDRTYLKMIEMEYERIGLSKIDGHNSVDEVVDSILFAIDKKLCKII